MANTTSFPKRRETRGQPSSQRAPKRLSSLTYKGAMRSALEDAIIGASGETLAKWQPLLSRVPGNHVVQAATWVGPRD